MAISIRQPDDRLHPLTYSVTFEVNETHGHTFREITYLTGGEAQDIVNGIPYNIKKCSVVFLGPMHYHRYHVRQGTKYEHRDIYVAENVFRTICGALGEHIYERFCDPERPAILTLTEDGMLALDARLRQLQLADPENISEEEHAIQRAIVAELVGHYVESYNLRQQPYPQWLLNLLAEMNRTEVVCGTFDNLVKISNYSAGHLSRAFRKYMGITLAAYFSDLKMKHALSLLVNTNMPVSEISSEIGYSSLSHFIHKFENRYKVSPSAYRAQFGKKSGR